MSFHDMFYPLRPISSDKPAPRPLIMAFDTEDNGTGVGTNFICGCVYEGSDASRQHVFWSREEMRRHIFKQHKYTTIAVAHNLRYDLDNIDYPEKTAERLHAKTKLIGAVFKFGDNKQMRLLDTGNFLVGASIHTLGEQLGYKKLGCRCEVSSYKSDGICQKCDMLNIACVRNKKPDEISAEAKANIAEYCMRDSEICYRTIEKLIEMTYDNQTRFRCYTAPSLACKIFRTKYMDRPWKKRTMLCNDIERLAYYGGRTEVFDYRYFEYVHAEDIKSSYPKAMHDEIYPYPSNPVHVRFGIFDALEYEGISVVRVRVPEMHIPPLPYRRDKDGKLLFPVGEWTAAYTHPEIRMAIEHGVEILDCMESIIYPDTFRPFTGFIDKFYNLKESTKGIEREFYKLLCNSLSGKWAEKRISNLTLKQDDPAIVDLICQCHLDTGSTPDPIPGTNLCSTCEKPSLAHSDVEKDGDYISLMGCRQQDPKNAFPILIAYITAYGRIKLYNERLCYGNHNNTVIYGDTDSAMSTNPSSFATGPNLGDWDRVTYEGFIAYAPKYYDFGFKECWKNGAMSRTPGVLKLKGVPRKHEIIYECQLCFGDAAETPEEVWKTNGGFCANCYLRLDDSSKRYKFERPLKTSEAERRHMNPNTWVIVKKHVSRLDNKRTRNRDDTSSPIRVYGTNYDSFTQILKKANPTRPV